MRRALFPAVLLSLTVCLSACVGTSEARRPDEFLGKNQSSSSSITKRKLPPKTAQQNSSQARSVVSSSQSSVAQAPLTPPADLKIPILVYHHLRDTSPYPKETWSYKMSVSPDVFATQMQWLVDHGYTTIDLDTLAEIFTGKRLGPTKPVVITFDDNQLSAYDVGVPILASHNQMAVFYLITNRLGNEASIGTQQIPDLLAKGMDVESHTVSHSGLTSLTDKQMDSELTDSKNALEAATGKPVHHLAYPHTDQNQRVRDHTAAAGYVTATIMDPRPATPKDSLLKLPRIMMTDDTDLAKVLP
jgi:peptidoglycan/xylan/chitin deacetylase (PgdA/CDA1 family)